MFAWMFCILDILLCYLSFDDRYKEERIIEKSILLYITPKWSE
jgi:hypothetical protein